MTVSRRDFLKQSAVISAAAMTTNLSVSETAEAVTKNVEAGWRWDRGVCRFCGVGCGIQIATHNGKIVATKADADAPVNRGLNCIKGYFNGKIIYGKDRLTQPLLRMKNGKFDKQGDFVPVTWERAFDEMEVQFKRHYKELGPTGIGFFASGQHTVQEGYAAVKLFRLVSAATTWIPMRAIAWPRQSPDSCRPSASTSLPATTTISSTLTP
jgi:nitrate reductase NapA